jgi:hypothetical protein
MNIIETERECGSCIRFATGRFIELSSQPHASAILPSEKKCKVLI